jgi:hypothetical protein
MIAKQWRLWWLCSDHTGGIDCGAVPDSEYQSDALRTRYENAALAELLKMATDDANRLHIMRGDMRWLPEKGDLL